MLRGTRKKGSGKQKRKGEEEEKKKGEIRRKMSEKIKEISDGRNLNSRPFVE